jgi:hypothetical protein
MPEIPRGFSFEETDDGYILRRNAAGEVSEIRMSLEEFDALKATIDLWKDRRLSEYRVAEGGEVRSIVVQPVAKAVLWPDAMKANILLNVVTQSAHMTLSLPPALATEMAGGLLHALAMLESQTKQ